MKKIHLFSILLAVLILVSADLYAQETGKIKAVMGDLPYTMTVSETYKVTVNITNTGTSEWSSEHLHGKESGKFEITKEWTGEWKLQPGETTQVYYKITAPGTAGIYKLKISIYYDKKRVTSRTRKINVTNATTPIK